MRLKNVIILLFFLFIVGTQTIMANAEEYEYDEDGRVITVRHDDGSYTEYEYDKNGNIVSAVTIKNKDDSKDNAEKQEDMDENSTENKSDDSKKDEPKSTENVLKENNDKSNDIAAKDDNSQTEKESLDMNSGLDKKKNNEETNSSIYKNGVITGDNIYIIPIIMALLASFSLIIIIFIKKRKIKVDN